LPSELGDLQQVYESSGFESLHPDGRPYEFEEWPLMRSIRDGEEVRDEEIVHLLADGSRYTMRCDSSPIYDDEGRIVAGVLMMHDITEQRRAEEQLAYHGYLLENIHDAVLASDEQAVLTAWNKGAEQMFGWRADEVLGRNGYEVLLHTEYSDEQLAEALRGLAEAGQRRRISCSPRDRRRLLQCDRSSSFPLA
jgi:PAS domain-containing protein